MSTSSASTAASRGSRPRPSRTDAIALLKADHRQVERWFKEFEKTAAENRQRELAADICKALRTHTTLEEEIFYPAFLQATGDESVHHEAIVEHAAAKKLIEEIERAALGDGFFPARVHVLSEMIKHHVKEEEKADGMFAKARKSDLDLEVLGRHLLSRKQQMSNAGAELNAQAAA